MGELRRNVVTGRWTVVAPRRAERPISSRPSFPASTEKSVRDPDPECPFCPGNEDRLPRVRWELPGPGEPGWRCRAVPNRFPAFRPDPGGEPGSAEEEPIPAQGRQEVIIESPRHGRDPSRMNPEELEAVVESYHRRWVAHREERPADRLFLFRNHGRDAGASLPHPHAQLVGIRFDPPALRHREERSKRYRAEGGGCLLCELEDVEPAFEERIVLDEGGFRAHVPWAPVSSAEVWIVPRRHEADFASLSSEEGRGLARVLGKVLGAYRHRAGDPAYNAILHSASGKETPDEGLHWFLQLRPRIENLAGFELASEMSIVSSAPESDAALLRG